MENQEWRILIFLCKKSLVGLFALDSSRQTDGQGFGIPDSVLLRKNNFSSFIFDDDSSDGTGTGCIQDSFLVILTDSC